MKKKIIALMTTVVLCGTSAFSAMATTPIKTLGESPLTAEIAFKNYQLELSLDKEKVQKKTGKKFKIEAETNYDGYQPKFYSTNKQVAVVGKNGVVKTKKPGTAKIIAECNGVKEVCKVKVVKDKPKKKIISDSTMSAIAGKIGKQTDYAYADSTIMCSAYAFCYAYYQVAGVYKTPGSVWWAGGCTWTGGTYRYLPSADSMLQTIKNEIDNGKACVGLLSQNGNTHYVTFYGYSGEGNTLSDYKVIDPWDGAIKNASNFGYYSYHVVTIN